MVKIPHKKRMKFGSVIKASNIMPALWKTCDSRVIYIDQSPDKYKGYQINIAKQ